MKCLVLLVMACLILSVPSIAEEKNPVRPVIHEAAWILRLDKVQGRKVALVRYLDFSTMALTDVVAVVSYRHPRRDDEVALCLNKSDPAWAKYSVCRLVKKSRAR